MLLLAGCGDEVADPDAGEGAAAAAAPFVVEGVPDGYELVAAGEGERRQEWGNDSAGTDEPFLVVTDGDRRVQLHTFGYEGLQGGFDQGAGKGRDDGWITEARDLGDDLGIKATSADVGRAVLVDLLDRTVEPEDRMDAPGIEDLPQGWSVVGHSDADVLLSLAAVGGTPIGVGPGPEGSPGAGWVGPVSSLSVVSLPGDAAEIDAWFGELPSPVLWYGDSLGEPVTVDGRDGVAVELTEGEGGTGRFLLTTMPDGSLLVVSSFGSPAPLSVAQLVEVAASVRPAGPDEWTAFTDSAWGGPDLRPDDGAVEVTRGSEDGQEWLLQATRTAPPDPNVEPDPNVGWHLDPCLKLLGGKRACPDGAGSWPGVYPFPASSSATESSGFPHSFHLVVTRLPGASVEITTRSGTTTSPLIPLPDGSTRVAVAFGDVPEGFSVSGCSALSMPEFDDNPDVEVFTVDILDESGDFVGCPPSIAMPPDSPELRIG